ncbi:hypothetical protein ACG33_12505 [Steroidobacter denitrificans]|uniref:2Fe-2S ferredoxin-type domain-containing protein n=1 Tax=Steroidobacter denitrificans TaxID=465721 RepID=A0A127FBZ6_STEDE|nr:hypothetical protein ACG33_12505 [Steroidobacter denitrificans]
MKLNVVDRDGQTHELEVPAQGSLMEALRDPDYGLAAACGGMCSCATCHVYVAPEWIDRVPDRQSDEHELLTELEFAQKHSRLSCQIPLGAHLDGLQLTLAPEE